jgi:L-fuconate dehydratase
VLKNGLLAYNTSVGWLGYSDEKIKNLCREALKEGWTHFKMKVGANLEDDIRRAEIIRNEIGWDNHLAMDANQRWSIDEAIKHMQPLAKFKPFWIEEPTRSPFSFIQLCVNNEQSG